MIKLFDRKIGATILRVFFGIIILKDFITYFLNRNYLFGRNGIVDYSTYEDIVSYYRLEWLAIDFDHTNNVIFFCLISIFCYKQLHLFSRW